MSKSVQLSDKVAERVQQRVASGAFVEANDVIEAAMQALDAQDEELELAAQLRIGIDEYERGEYLDWSPALNERLFEEAVERYRAGERPGTDVI